MTLSVPHVKVILEFQHKSGIPRDNTQITLYYRPPGGTIPIDPGSGSVAVDNLAQALTDWISNPIPPNTNSMAALLGPSVMRGFPAAEMKLYALATERQLMGPPFASRLLTVAGNAPSAGLPAEVAACLTYHADLTNVPERGPNNTRPASSRRGRFYWGPLTTVGVVEPATGRVTIGQVGRETLINAAAKQLFEVANQASWRWVVFSPKLWEAFEVHGVWADDAFDTQRRRGEDPVVRSVATF